MIIAFIYAYFIISLVPGMENSQTGNKITF
jgi:hypothetical protein